MNISSSSEHAGPAAAESVTVWVDGEAFRGLDGHTIGRDDSASITVNHRQVSRRHATLQFDGFRWSVTDLGSTNGIHDETGRKESIPLPVGRTQIWLGPPASSPAVHFDVENTGPLRPPSNQGGTAAPPTRFAGGSHSTDPALAGRGPGTAPTPTPSGPLAGPGAGPTPPGGQARSAPPPPSGSAPYVPPQFVDPGSARHGSGPTPAPPPGLGGGVAPPPAPHPGPLSGQAPPSPGPLSGQAPPSPGPLSGQAPPSPVATPPPHHAPPGGAGAPPPGGPSPQGGPPSPVLNSSGLEQNIGQLSQVINPHTSELIIGRAVDCDISIPDPLVSRKHARLVLNPGGGRIIDLGSDNGTFVNGQRVVDSPIVEGDLVELGKAQFVLSGGKLQQHVAHGLPLVAESLTVTVGDNLVLLNDISFKLPAGSMTAVIGPSGSGKSTLLNALTGQRPADQGRVLLGGRDLYSSDEGLGRRIGFVPQDDPVHDSLTVRQALTSAAKLRLPVDTSRAEVKATVEQVAVELGLAQRLDTRVRALSGGQRKRVSVGYELVGQPQAMILDEPTSGLDPGLERELMSSLRQLADKGTTTIVVTHSVQSVELCDLVLVLAPGGRLAFVGPPSKVADHFRCNDLASVFTLLGTRQQAEWEMEFARTTSYLKFGAQAPPETEVPSTPLPPRSFSYDLRIMLVRYLRQLAGDPRRLALLLLQGPILGLFFALVLDRNAFGLTAELSATRQFVLASVLAMILLGGFNSVREIVQERSVFRREMVVGVSPVANVLSKWVVLGVVSIVQAFVFHLVASFRQVDAISPGVLIGSGDLEFMIALAGIAVASVGIGLVVSAAVDDTSKALTLLPLILIPVFALSGLVVPTAGRAGIEQVTYVNPAQWGSSAAAATIDLQGISGCEVFDANPTAPGLPDDLADTCENDRWDRTSGTQLLNLSMVWIWSLILLVVAGLTSKWSMSRPLRR